MNALIRVKLANTQISNIRSLSILHNYNYHCKKDNILQKQRNKTFLQCKRQLSYNETIGNIWQSISNSTPVAYFQDGLVQFHDTSGLPWWATIIASTIILRTAITFPLAIYQVFKIHILTGNKTILFFICRINSLRELRKFH